VPGLGVMLGRPARPPGHGQRERHLRPRSRLSSAGQAGLVPRGVLADLPLRSLAGRARSPDPLHLPWDNRGRGGSRLLTCVFHRASAPSGPAPRLGLLECRVVHAGAQRGQGGIVVRDAWHVGVQPAAAAGFQD
jgi:hypothetical protein